MPAYRAKTSLRVRKGHPKTSAPVVRVLAVGEIVTSGEVVTGENVNGIKDWAKLAGDQFVWMGGLEKTAAQPDDDPDPDRPGRIELGIYGTPVFERVPGITHKIQGPRPSGLEGLIVHFDAFRIRAAGNGAENSDQRAKETLATGQSNGYHYAAVSRTGRILVPANFNFSHWGSHAGKSVCPATGREGVSRFYLGLELNNPGQLFATADAAVFCPWFNVVRHPAGHPKAGQPILDADGKAKRRSENDEWYAKADVRWVKKTSNIAAGWYLPYSDAQMEAVAAIALHLARQFPSTFRLDRVFGHDEVSPSRKTDPGGAMGGPSGPMTMADFRKLLKDLA